MQNDKIEELRASLNTATNAYNNASLASTIVQSLNPTPRPAYVVSSPYASGCGCNTYGTTTYGTTL